MRAFLSIIVAVICCSSVLAGSAPALEETPHYLRSKEAFLADYYWLPKGTYTHYGVTSYRKLPNTEIEYLQESDSIDFSGIEKVAAPATQIIRQAADYVFFANAMNIKPVPVDFTGTKNLPENITEEQFETTKRRLESRKNNTKDALNVESPLTFESTKLRLYAVLDPAAVLNQLLRAGHAEQVGKTEINPTAIFKITLKDSGNARLASDFYCIAGADGMLVCASDQDMLNLMQAARHGLLETMGDDEQLQQAAQYYHLASPSYALGDNRYVRIQTQLQYERLGISEDDILEDHRQQYQPTFSFSTMDYLEDRMESSQYYLFIDEGASEEQVAEFVKMLRRGMEQNASQRAQNRTYTFDIHLEDDYALITRSSGYEQSLKAQRERAKMSREQYLKQRDDKK